MGNYRLYEEGYRRDAPVGRLLPCGTILQCKTSFLFETSHRSENVPRGRLYPESFLGLRSSVHPWSPTRGQPPLMRGRDSLGFHARPPELGSVAQTRLRDQHGLLFTVWQPCDDHHRHRRARGDCQDPRQYRLVHQSPTPFAGTGLPSLSDGRSPPATRLNSLPSCFISEPTPLSPARCGAKIQFIANLFSANATQTLKNGIYYLLFPLIH